MKSSGLAYNIIVASEESASCERAACAKSGSTKLGSTFFDGKALPRFRKAESKNASGSTQCAHDRARIHRFNISVIYKYNTQDSLLQAVGRYLHTPSSGLSCTAPAALANTLYTSPYPAIQDRIPERLPNGNHILAPASQRALMNTVPKHQAKRTTQRTYTPFTPSLPHLPLPPTLGISNLCLSLKCSLNLSCLGSPLGPTRLHPGTGQSYSVGDGQCTRW